MPYHYQHEAGVQVMGVLEVLGGCCAMPILLFWILVIYGLGGYAWGSAERRPINKFFVGLVLFLMVMYIAVYIKLIYYTN